MSSQAKNKPSLALLVMITISGTLAMHMFVPALPAATQALATSSSNIQLTISIYILGLAVGQLLYGPLSDTFGRRPLLMIGLTLYTVAGIFACLATSVEWLISARLFQALGGCAGLVLGRAIIRDTSEPTEAVSSLALLNLMMMAGPGLAPFIGSVLTSLGSWRYIFVMLSSLGFITLILSFFKLPETASPTYHFAIKQIAQHYQTLLSQRSFLGFAIGGSCATTSIYAFVVAAPFIFSQQLHQSMQKSGLYLGLLLIGMSMGNILTKKLIHYLSINHLLIGGNLLSLFSASSFLLLEYSHHLSMNSVIISMLCFAIGAGVTSPAALAKSLHVELELVGSAAGIYGCLQMLIGALCSFLVGFGENPALMSASVLAGATIFSQLAFWIALAATKQQASNSSASS